MSSTTINEISIVIYGYWVADNSIWHVCVGGVKLSKGIYVPVLKWSDGRTYSMTEAFYKYKY